MQIDQAKMRSLKGDLIHYDWCPFKNRRRQRHTREDGHVTIEAEIEAVNPQAKQCPELSVTNEGGRGKEGSLQVSEGAWLC